MRYSLLLGLVGCGRIAFDPITVGDASLDAYAYVSPCPIGTTAPDPLTMSGTAQHFGVPQGSTTVSALATLGGTPLATTTTPPASGAFSLSIPTGGSPIAVYLSIAKTGYLTSMGVPDRKLDGNVTGIIGYMGNQTDVNGIYNTPSPNVVQDPTAGIVLVQVRDCAGTGIGGATLMLPPPTRIVYSGGNGLPSSTATSTGASGAAWALNVPVGSVLVDVVAPGRSFVPTPIDVLQSSTYFMGATITAVP